MKRDKLEELLSEYKEIDIEIRDLNYRIYSEDIKGVAYDDMPKSPNSNTNSSVESSLIMIEKLKRNIKELENKKNRIENLLDILNDRDKTILRMYYVNDLTLRDISFKLDLSDKYVSSKKNKIIDRLVPYACKYGLI